MSDDKAGSYPESENADNSQMKNRIRRQSEVSPDKYPKKDRDASSLVNSERGTDKASKVDK